MRFQCEPAQQGRILFGEQKECTLFEMGVSIDFTVIRIYLELRLVT